MCRNMHVRIWASGSGWGGYLFMTKEELQRGLGTAHGRGVYEGGGGGGDTFNVLHMFFPLHPITYSGLPRLRMWHCRERTRTSKQNATFYVSSSPISIFPKVDTSLFVSVEKHENKAITDERWCLPGSPHITNSDILHASGAQWWQQCGLILTLLRILKRRWLRQNQWLDWNSGNFIRWLHFMCSRGKFLLLWPHPWWEGCEKCKGPLHMRLGCVDDVSRLSLHVFESIHIVFRLHWLIRKYMAFYWNAEIVFLAANHCKMGILVCF